MKGSGSNKGQAWSDEVLTCLEVAKGDLALFLALLALRKTENGGPQQVNPKAGHAGQNPYIGGEFGVQTVKAETFRRQAEVAATSLRNHELRYTKDTQRPARLPQGIYAPAFLEHFSHRWAPPEAHTLNVFHAANLNHWYGIFFSKLLGALTKED